jgi:hypothetical protein
MYLGAPWMLMRRDTTSMTHRERMLPATSMARHSGGPFVDHRQALELLPVGAAVEDEVVGPHLVGRLRRRWPRPAARDTLPRPLARHLELRLAPQPVGSLSPGFDDNHIGETGGRARALPRAPVRRAWPGATRYPRAERTTDSRRHARPTDAPRRPA